MNKIIEYIKSFFRSKEPVKEETSTVYNGMTYNLNKAEEYLLYQETRSLDRELTEVAYEYNKRRAFLTMPKQGKLARLELVPKCDKPNKFVDNRVDFNNDNDNIVYPEPCIRRKV